MKRVNFHLTSQQMVTLERIRADTGIKVAELIRRAVDEYIQNSDFKHEHRGGSEASAESVWEESCPK